ncbi:MAG: SH3 domain-containing protein [Lachnospiraceae bacterium]|nr:SH3 domain-containing protein [Lachnospiraceae bacterium]
MKKKSALMAVLAFTVMLFGCGADSDNAPENTEAPTVQEATAEVAVTPKPTEAPHEHIYTEAITTEAACTSDGLKTFTCECGDSYTETIAATGHSFENYISNNDATDTTDGTETAQCNFCNETDTRTAAGSIHTYTYTDMDATMYAQQTVNIRSIPDTDGEKLGSLSANDEVKVTGQCAETGWYRIEYNGNAAYVSNSYLGTDKAEVKADTPVTDTTQTASSGYKIVLKSGYSYVNTTVSSYTEACAVFSAIGYTPWQIIDEGDKNVWAYCIVCHAPYTEKGTHSEDFDHTESQIVSILEERGYSPYPYGNTGRLNTKDGRIYVEDAGGGSWSIGVFGKVE